MAATMAAHVETGALVITLSGRWGIGQARALRQAITRGAAHFPPYLVVDFARLGTGRLAPTMPTAVVLLRERCLPGTTLLLCAPTAVLRSLLRHVPARRIRCYRRLPEALRDIPPYQAPASVRRVHLRMAATPDAAARARRLVRACCDRWGLPATADDGQLVVSELVANAVEHAGTDIDLTVSNHSGQLRIAVGDRHPVVPNFPGRRGEPGRTGLVRLAPRGRGLGLVRRCVTDCGVLRGIDGKVVWAAVGSPSTRRNRLQALVAVPGRHWRSPRWLRRFAPVPRPRLAPRPRLV